MLDFGWRPRLNTMTRNAWGLTFGGGVQAAERTPSEQLHRGHHRDLHRFGAERRSDARPVLLVPPLAVSATCYDLRPGQSMAAHLLEQGHATYLVDYGTMTSADRAMGFEAWVDDILPEAIRRVCDLHDGAPVDLVGWSLGGTISLLTAAAHADLPIRSVTAVGTPIDYTRIPALAPLRALGRVTSERPLTAATWALGGMPASVVQMSYRMTALQRELLRPWFIARNLHDTESLARMEAIDRFMAAMPGYPARFFHQMCSQLVIGNTLAAGQFRFSDRVVELSDLVVPVLAVGGTTDVLAPAACVEAVVPLLTGSPSVRFEGVAGSHLGLVAGPGARDTTWRFIDEFLAAPTPAI